MEAPEAPQPVDTQSQGQQEAPASGRLAARRAARQEQAAFQEKLAAQTIDPTAATSISEAALSANAPAISASDPAISATDAAVSDGETGSAASEAPLTNLVANSNAPQETTVSAFFMPPEIADEPTDSLDIPALPSLSTGMDSVLQATAASSELVAPAPPTCRHEYVRIYQRKIKGLERRMTATRAWLPVGFKQADFGHLSEGSYCFCATCRARLYPKRTAAEKAQARIDLAASKAAAAAQAEQEALEMLEEEAIDNGSTTASIHVEELEVESVELTDLEDGSVALPDAQDCQLSTDE